MPVARYWNGSAWADVAGVSVYEQPDEPAPDPGIGAIWIDTDAPDPLPLVPVGAVLGFQEDYGTTGAYSASTSANPSHNILKDASTLMSIAYTPTVDAWWELSGYIGTVQALSASYGALQAALVVTPLPPGLASTTVCAGNLTQHSTVQTFETRVLSRRVPLTGGVAYTAYMAISATVGTYQYFRAQYALWIEGKAIKR